MGPSVVENCLNVVLNDKTVLMYTKTSRIIVYSHELLSGQKKSRNFKKKNDKQRKLFGQNPENYTRVIEKQ